jgi:hypothetical protein
MKLSKAVKDVINLSEAIRAYWDRELPRLHPEYPIIRPGEKEAPPPAEEKKLRQLFAKLPEDIIYQIALIMYLGRGDFGIDKLADRYETLKQQFDDAQDAALQMTEKASLADDLADGLEELKRHNIDVDKLPLDSTTARK